MIPETFINYLYDGGFNFKACARSTHSISFFIQFKRFPNISDFVNEVIADVTICRNCPSPVSRSRRNYCSEECMFEFNRNHDWFWIRQDVLRRDKFRCCICVKRFRKSLLDVDHIIPVRLGINPFDKNNLRVLCKECHKAKSRLDREANL